MFSGYTGFFGLNEVPFSIAPNPHYLFMSDRHREALAHLSYGLGETGGFALLTGEVGTGKTTVSRCLLEQLPENAQVAYIINPTLSAMELLASVCDELNIDYPADNASLKVFTDLISARLLDNHQQGLSTLLIIDEAQHLQAEVLEQLRLLTNLETNARKLLQVILIGQPELQQLLKRQDLRQLAQRITARYHLMPLSVQEVGQYIKHRLNVAGCERPLFTPSAIRSIHRYSQGVPRLINLICDRALLAAYTQEKTQVDNKLIKEAAIETLGDSKPTGQDWGPWLKRSAIAAAIMVCAIAGKQLGSWQQQSVQALSANTLLSGVTNRDINNARELQVALMSLFKTWHLNLPADELQACQQALDFSLSCHWLNVGPEQLISLGYPALVEFEDDMGQLFYGVININQDNADRADFSLPESDIQLNLAGISRAVDLDWLQRHYRGSALLLWQPPAGFVEQIDSQSSIDLIQWLENRLSLMQARPQRTVNEFDQRLKNQLQQFQRKMGLTVLEYADLGTVVALANPGNFAAITPQSVQVQQPLVDALANVQRQRANNARKVWPEAGDQS
ncbi:ExeA family protein [Thalassotalea mangrovi]|uniref:AAA family ATPase n=1 Tax=Thalassotalea mangrovi TaxID=2572245 RepID=A0A4U1B900_9GAMM|nr:AAA family ATPase [Thalassotalea mangrovi]TKB47179.1 AAA family ATPase [Thalassotalea mangrovi]